MHGHRIPRVGPGDCEGGGRPGGGGRAYRNFGNAYRSLGDLLKAIEYHAQDLAIAKEVGNRAKVGQTYGNLGTVHLYLNNYDKDLAYQKECHALASSLKVQHGRESADGAAP